MASNYNQSVSFTGGSGTNTTVSGSATNAPVPTPILQVTPGSIGYGTLLVGTSKTNSFTVQNIGTGTLSGTASVSAPFSVVSGGSYSLGANASQTVVVAFSPSGGEQLQPECELYGREWDEHDGERERDQCAGAHAGPPGDAGEYWIWDVAGGDEPTNSFTVQNTGTGTLSGTASVSAPFSVVSGGSYSLGANASQTVVVAFSPAVASNYNQSVSFTGGSGTNTTVSGSATNAPVPTPILQVTPGSIAYGTLLVGTSKTNSFTVQNVGTGTLSGTASVSAPFSVVSGGSYSLGANASQTVVVVVQSGGGEQLQPECELYGREWDERDGERERDQRAGAHADPPGDAGEHWVWDVVGGDEQDEQFHGAEHRDGDIERDGECERAVQCGVGRQLQSGRQREPDGDGGVQSDGGEQLQPECELYGREWDERDGERERDQCASCYAYDIGDQC